MRNCYATIISLVICIPAKSQDGTIVSDPDPESFLMEQGHGIITFHWDDLTEMPNMALPLSYKVQFNDKIKSAPKGHQKLEFSYEPRYSVYWIAAVLWVEDANGNESAKVNKSFKINHHATNVKIAIGSVFAVGTILLGIGTYFMHARISRARALLRELQPPAAPAAHQRVGEPDEEDEIGLEGQGAEGQGENIPVEDNEGIIEIEMPQIGEPAIPVRAEVDNGC